jgi:hypothetical protein
LRWNLRYPNEYFCLYSSWLRSANELRPSCSSKAMPRQKNELAKSQPPPAWTSHSKLTQCDVCLVL